MNTAVTIVGNVVDTPEKGGTYGEDNKSIVNLRVAVNDWINGESVLQGYFDVTVFGDQADNVLDQIKKGERIVVTGNLRHTTYEREDGTKGSRTRINARAVGKSLEFKAKP